MTNIHDILPISMLSILLKFLAIVISSIGFLFLFWRELKEDYTRNQIFTVAFTSLLGLYLGAIIGIIIPKFPSSPIFNMKGIWFWLGIILSTSVVLFFIYKFKMRIYEVFESYIISLIFLSLVWSLVLFPLAAVVFLIIWVIFFIVDKNYKEFGWYKSGKTGLASLISLATFFILRAIVAILNPNMISFVGRIDAVISAIVAFLLFLSIYNLSEKI